MNRKEKRKSKNKKLYVNKETENQEINNMIKIFVGVLVVFFAVYFGYAIYNGEFASKPEDEEGEVEFQNTYILAGTTFNMSNEEYYVMYYDKDDNYAPVLETLYSSYIYLEGASKMYIVDLTNKFNESYVLKEDEKLNKAPKNIDELKVENPTLIKIKDKKVEKFLTGHEDIKTYLLKVIEENKTDDTE